MRIIWEQVDGAGIRDTLEGLDIIRPILVTEMSQDCSDGRNSAALAQALTAPDMPLKGVAHETVTNAFLEERNVRSLRSVDTVAVDLVYKQRILEDGGHGNSSNWALTDSYNASHVITYAVADGSQAIKVWYKKGGKQGNIGDDKSPLAKSVVRVAGVHKLASSRVLTASATLRGTDWDGWKAQVRASAGKINSDVWGSDPRGTWYFVGPVTKYVDPRRRTVRVELTFIHNVYGHFPIARYVNELGVVPADEDDEKDLRRIPPGIAPAGQLPPASNIWRLNGITIASVQLEAAFSPVFAFTPTL